MKKLFSLLLLLGVFASASVLARAEGAMIGTPAPALSFKDIVTGQEVSLAALKGKVVVVDFWATWCGPCLMEIPGYIEMQKAHGKAGLVIVGVSVDQKSAEQVKKFAQSKGMNYHVVMGGGEEVEAFGGFDGIPTTFLINREGKIIHQKTGAMSHAEYEALVRKAL